MSECVFCKIVAKQIPATLLFEDEHLIAFKDIHPKAPVHVLVVPKKHIESLAHQTPSDAHLMGHLTQQLPKIAHSLGLDKGFKTLINTGKAGGQEVFHLHYHILGG